jgi:hypothetical protein
LESLTTIYRTPIVTSESIASYSGDGRMIFRFVDYLRVKGKTKAERVYELLCPEIVGTHIGKMATLDKYNLFSAGQPTNISPPLITRSAAVPTVFSSSSSDSFPA